MTPPPSHPGMDAFEVVREGDGFLVVNKSAGLLVHPTKPDGPPTLWHGLRALLAYELATGGQISLINRLDRETSGLTLVATTTASARACGLAMMDGRIRKSYLALATGWPSLDAWEQHGPILRLQDVAPSPVQLLRTVHPLGAAAHTRFQVLARTDSPWGPLSLIRAWPITGRTHQIRVHLSAAGFPILGDKLYGPSPECYLEFIRTGWTPALADRLRVPCHALHSETLEFPSPTDSEETIRVSAGPPPWWREHFPEIA